MGYSVKFRNTVVRDNTVPLTLESSIRRTSAFAGIHDFQFRDTLDEVFDDLAAWTLDTADGTTWDVTSGNLATTGGSGTRWYQARHDNEAAPSFVASFDLISGQGGILFRGRNGTREAFIAWWTGSNCGFGRIDADGTKTDLCSMPYGITGPARMQLAVSYDLDAVDENRKWLRAALFVDGNCYAEMATDIGGTAQNWHGDYVGFAVYAGQSLTVDNLRVPELKRIVEWTSIEEGSSAAEGQSRAIATTRVATMARFNGALRAWLPGNRDLDWTADADRQIRLMDRRNVTDTITHVRSQGALHQMDAFYDDEGDVHLHRFALHNNPNLVSEEEGFEEAERVLHDAQERQCQMSIEMPPMTLLEPHDRIDVGGEDWRVITIALDLTMQEHEPQYSSVIEARRYIEFVPLEELGFILTESGEPVLTEAGEEVEVER